MRDSLLRLTVCAPGSGAPAVDVTVPADCPVGTLLPDLVDIVIGPASAEVRRRWYLSRLTGGRLDNSNGLRDNGVADGDIVILDVTGVPAPRRSSVDAAAAVAAAVAPGTPRPEPWRDGAGLVVLAVVAAVLVWPNDAGASLWCAAGLSAVAAVIVVIDRRCPLPHTLGAGAVVCASATGYLAASGMPWTVAVTFAATAGTAMSILLARALSSVTQVALAAAGVVALVTAAVGTSTSLPVGRCGAVLTICAVAALTMAPRVVIGACGLSPARVTVDPGRAVSAHRLQRGIVVGSAATVGLGCVGSVADGSVAGVAVAAVTGLAVSLRARHHRDSVQRLACAGSGLAAGLAAWVGATVLWPAQLPWLVVGAAVAGVGSAYHAHRSAELSPVVRQGGQILECAALAALVPLALWVTGLYGWARGLGLS
ncbi:type VII secretion integral membrane protein EccD [Mycobacterium sp. pV006]|uniref:type VII secretion integral membrane protein EccD n=1 Tax=Mycobacterium sp. pV006 TaxID=3238983 RepID=UPI00351ADA95